MKILVEIAYKKISLSSGNISIDEIPSFVRSICMVHGYNALNIRIINECPDFSAIYVFKSYKACKVWIKKLLS
jgi:hypothetical protein